MNDVPVVTPFYLDKGIWVAILTPLLLWLNQRFGLALDPAVIVAMVLPAVAYILGHKWKTGTILAAQAAGVAAAQAPGPNLNG